MPFCKLRLAGHRPRVLPRGYPIEVRTLGDHLRRRRLDLGLNQRTVAEQLGVCMDAVTLWENGRARPLVRHYGPIIRFLGYDPEPSDRSLAGRLRAVRRRLGLSQAKFAARVGLDEGSVCRWESGCRRPSRWMATRVTAILDALEPSKETEQDPPTYYELTRWRRSPVNRALPGHLGERLRSYRLTHRVTQEAAAELLRVHRATIRRWESGRGIPRQCHAESIKTLIL